MFAPSAGRSRRFAWMLAVGLVALLAALAGWWFLHRPQTPSSAAPLSPSPYLNTGPDAEYVGSAACVRCHAEEYRAYQRTGMSRSAAEVDPDKEPPDGALDHTLSGVRFEAFRRGGRLRHRELLLNGDRADVVLNDFPLAYVIGSGRHSRTYAVETDGFLVESPLTWYTSRDRWDMSPGYDQPAHLEFARPVGTQCLFCHTGRYELQDQSTHRYRIVEAAIGCERCHGPGSLHVALRDRPEGPPPNDGTDDLTIVNPRRLSRDLAEAVCQQCHLAGDLTVPTRGRKLTDFRPGLPLQDVTLVYRLADAGGGMTVTGHVEQLHQSKCYQKSAGLTCTTCHDPHGFPTPEQRTNYYRAACLACHAEAACTADAGKRRKESPENSCVQCHMPTGSTDVPHVAFSHHRIGVHAGALPRQRVLPSVSPSDGREALEPFHDLSRLSPADRKRALGLAYTRAGGHREAGEGVRAYNARARHLLGDVWEAGTRDGAVASALAGASYRLGLPDVRVYAEAALRDPELEGQDRCDALFLAADDEFKRGEYAAAAGLFRQVTRLRRNAADWSYLAKCERALGREAEGVRALEKAAEIAPLSARFHRELVELYGRRGDKERAEWHRRRIPPDARR